ncbi:MAG: PP2C family protein-serine/threonine phosphatase [Flavobacteriales bacterium]|nr:PP2C family protein-serine/threonine phosphatase [Flavobacteriales bacterium]
MTRLDRLNDRLGLKEFQLKALLEVTKAINNNLDRSGLLHLYKGIINQELGIFRLLLFERSEQWECVLRHGTALDETLPDLDRIASEGSDIRLIGPEAERALSGFDVVVPVFHQDRPLAYLFIGDLDEDEQRMSPSVKHLNFIQTLTNLIVVALENKRLALQALQQERDKREMELAAEMQSMLVPGDLPRTDRFHAAAWYQPHRQVGGDYYDVIQLAPDRLILVIADVSGKGIAAALLMSNFQATLHALVRHSDAPLEDLVRDLNDKVYGNARGERFITLFIGDLDLGTGRMRYVNAGHNPSLLRTENGFEELSSGSIALGMMPKLPFITAGTTTLPSGSLLFNYTDGLVEQEDAHGNAFDMDALRRTIDEMRSSGPEAVNASVIARFEAHRAGLPYLDDIAVLTCAMR